MNFERPEKIALDFKIAHTRSGYLNAGNFRKIEMSLKALKILVYKEVHEF